ncbi:MAG: alpha/beta fold hydrolase [Gaiellaceae bacterium]
MRLTAVTASPRVDRTFGLADRRRLAYCEWGDPGGQPTVLLHGWQGSRLFCPDEAATVDAGVRLITIDRPGFGRSDPRRDRSLLNWVDDYAELLRHLGILGARSWGGLAAAPTRLPARFGCPKSLRESGSRQATGRSWRCPAR